MLNQYPLVPEYKQKIIFLRQIRYQKCICVRILSCKKFRYFLFCHDIVLRHKLKDKNEVHQN